MVVVGSRGYVSVRVTPVIVPEARRVGNGRIFRVHVVSRYVFATKTVNDEAKARMRQHYWANL